MNKLYTIGFAGKSAEEFFNLLVKNNIKTLMDIRTNNKSQLAAFTKEEDLKYFLGFFNIKYKYIPELAPSRDLLKAYRNKKVSWEEYERSYLKQIKDFIPQKKDFENSCLLCSETTPEKCHRGLAANFIESITDLTIEHL